MIVGRFSVAPTCKPGQDKVHGVAKQEVASITCAVDANPPVVEFRWTFNNSAESLIVPPERVKWNGTNSTAIHTPLMELDYGTLLCWAKNSIGNQQIPCVYHIIPAGNFSSCWNFFLSIRGVCWGWLFIDMY